jgi:tRNA (guanine-N7-)-methyltransferase
MPRRPSISLDRWFRTLDTLPPPPFHDLSVFPTSLPLELEVGSGRGLFLQNAGTACPDRNFLGVECDLKEAKRAAARLAKRNLTNTCVVGGDVKILMARYFGLGAFQGVHVYFPDPWWKKRHYKRRMFSPPFVNEAVRLLQPGGLLHLWTDVPAYFEMAVELVRDQPEFEQLPPPEERPPSHDMDYHTSFERKKRQLGLTIHRACWRRSDAPPPPSRAEELLAHVSRVALPQENPVDDLDDDDDDS